MPFFFLRLLDATIASVSSLSSEEDDAVSPDFPSTPVARAPA